MLDIFTARVRSTYDGRLCFHRCVSVQLSGGGVPHLRSGQGRYPIPDLGVPHSANLGTPSQVWSGGGGYPILPMGWWVPPIQDWIGPPPSKIGWATSLPPLIQTWDRGVPWVPSVPRLNGVPPSRPGIGGVPWVPPPSAKRALTTRRRCASSVHAGGLSCHR